MEQIRYMGETLKHDKTDQQTWSRHITKQAETKWNRMKQTNNHVQGLLWKRVKQTNNHDQDHDYETEWNGMKQNLP